MSFTACPRVNYVVNVQLLLFCTGAAIHRRFVTQGAAKKVRLQSVRKFMCVVCANSKKRGEDGRVSIEEEMQNDKQHIWLSKQ